MSRGKALALAVLNDHFRCGFAFRGKRLEFLQRSRPQSDQSICFELLKNFIECRSGCRFQVWGRNLCNCFAAIGDDESFTFADGTEIASEAVLEFAAADLDHCSYLRSEER